MQQSTLQLGGDSPIGLSDNFKQYAENIIFRAVDNASYSDAGVQEALVAFITGFGTSYIQSAYLGARYIASTGYSTSTIYANNSFGLGIVANATSGFVVDVGVTADATVQDQANSYSDSASRTTQFVSYGPKPVFNSDGTINATLWKAQINNETQSMISQQLNDLSSLIVEKYFAPPTQAVSASTWSQQLTVAQGWLEQAVADYCNVMGKKDCYVYEADITTPIAYSFPSGSSSATGISTVSCGETGGQNAIGGGFARPFENSDGICCAVSSANSLCSLTADCYKPKHAISEAEPSCPSGTELVVAMATTDTACDKGDDSETCACHDDTCWLTCEDYMEDCNAIFSPQKCLDDQRNWICCPPEENLPGIGDGWLVEGASSGSIENSSTFAAQVANQNISVTTLCADLTTQTQTNHGNTATCPSGYVVSSCGVDADLTTQGAGSSYPISSTECMCMGEYNQCSVTCIQSSLVAQHIYEQATSTTKATVACSSAAGLMRVGCGMVLANSIPLNPPSTCYKDPYFCSAYVNMVSGNACEGYAASENQFTVYAICVELVAPYVFFPEIET